MTDLEYEAFERYCIMINQPDVTEEQAIAYINKIYGEKTAMEIIWSVIE